MQATARASGAAPSDERMELSHCYEVSWPVCLVKTTSVFQSPH